MCVYTRVLLARLAYLAPSGQNYFSGKLPVITVADHYYWPYLSKTRSRVPDSLFNLERYPVRAALLLREVGSLAYGYTYASSGCFRYVRRVCSRTMTYFRRRY